MSVHRPVVRQDPGTGCYFWNCSCGAHWEEDPDNPFMDDALLEAESSAIEHRRRMEQIKLDGGYLDGGYAEPCPECGAPGPAGEACG